MGLFDFQKTKTIKCEECGDIVPMKSPSQRFCAVCGRKRRRELANERKRVAREQRKTVRKIQPKPALKNPQTHGKAEEIRSACNGCAHDGAAGGVRCCDYKVHQIDYHLPRRQHPVPMAQECLFYSRKQWSAGRLSAKEIEHLQSTKGRPLINTLTGQVARDCKEAAEMDGRSESMIYIMAKKPRTSTKKVEEWRFFADEELALLGFVGVKRRADCNKTAAWK